MSGIIHEIWTYEDGNDDNKLKYDGFVYETRSVNTKGVTNRFNELFWINDSMNGKAAEQNSWAQEIMDPNSNDKPVLKPHGQFYTSMVIGGMIVEIHDFNEENHPDVWRQLYLLREGKFKVRSDAQAGDLVDCDEGGKLVGTAAQQKAAYKKWAKENLTGYVRYRVVDLSGRDMDAFQKITVNIDALLDSRKD